MKYLTKEYNAKIELKKSSFIAYLCPFKDFKRKLIELKKEHTKAVHFVYAYRFLNDFHQIIEDKSDDGEPKGTSGQSVLNVLRGKELVNTALIVVRYFGGIKLGTGGLVRAYSEASHAVLAEASLEEYEPKNTFELDLSFTLLAQFEHFLHKEKIEVKKNFLAGGVRLSLELSLDEEARLKAFIKDFVGLELKKL